MISTIKFNHQLRFVGFSLRHRNLLTRCLQDPNTDAADPDDDDNVHIQVEADEDEDEPILEKLPFENDADDQFNQGFINNNANSNSNNLSKNNAFPNNHDQFFNNGMDANDFSSMMNGFNNMDYNQMMQMMAGGMGNFNAMMGKFHPILSELQPTNYMQECLWE